MKKGIKSRGGIGKFLMLLIIIFSKVKHEIIL
jgi:hypothetical protein